MNLEKIIEAIFGVILLSTIGFLAVQIFDMKGNLSTVSAKLESTDNRISRIAEVLPEVKARVAWEEVNEPLRGFVLSTHVNGGRYSAHFKTYNADTSLLKTYTVALSETHKEHLTNVVAGKIRTVDRYAPTFTELAYHSAENKEPVTFPANLNSDASYVIRNTNVEKIDDYLQKISKKKPKVSQIAKVANWKDLSLALDGLAIVTIEKDNKPKQQKGVKQR